MPPLHQVTPRRNRRSAAARRPGRMPAHRLSPGTVPDGEDVRPASRDTQRPDRRPVAGAVPQRVQDEPGEHGREQDDEVPQPDLAGQEGEHHHRDDGPEEGQQSGVGVVEEAGDVREPGGDGHRHRPQSPGEHDTGVPGAPPVLLTHEGVEIVRADPGREHDRQVDHGPAGPAHVKPGVHVLGVRDERRAALRLQRGPPVDRGGPDADRRAEPVAGHLDGPVEHLLDRPRGVLDPGLRGAAAEELGCLDDRDRRVVQVRERLGEEVAAAARSRRPG